MTRPWQIMGVAALAAALLSGCAMAALPPPTATLDNIQAVRKADLPSMAVGSFTPGPGRPAEMDKVIVIRAASQAAPGGSFAKYLGDTVAAELKGSGKLDAASTLVISGVLTDTHVDSSLDLPTAKVAAKFTLMRGGVKVYEKTLQADASWDGNLLGAIAIPDSFNHYVGLFPVLANQLFSDPDFIAAAHGH